MYDKIKAINKQLEDQGASVVQKKPGLGNREALYGYIPQAVFDAVASVTSCSNFINHFEFTEKQAIAQVTVTIEAIAHSQFGESQIIRGDKGSAIKGAVTDAIQKALALFGIGTKAYRGELGNVYNDKISQTITGDVYALLRDEAIKLTDRKTSLRWWKDNLDKIKKTSQEDRDELVLILGKLK